MTRLIVRSHHPWRLRLALAMVLVASAVAAWGLFEYGRYRGGFDVQAAERAHAELLRTNDEQLASIVRLREQQAVLERSAQIEREAYRQLEGTVTELQDEILELKEELAFYRGIVSPSDANQGLRLQDFDIVRGAGGRGWHYKLVLTQVLKNDRVATGTVHIEFDGAEDGKARKLALKEIGGQEGLPFKFKYFQDIEGDIVLPSGFVPAKVIVRVEPRNKEHSRLEEVFDWPTEQEI